MNEMLSVLIFLDGFEHFLFISSTKPLFSILTVCCWRRITNKYLKEKALKKYCIRLCYVLSSSGPVQIPPTMPPMLMPKISHWWYLFDFLIANLHIIDWHRIFFTHKCFAHTHVSVLGLRIWPMERFKRSTGEDKKPNNLRTIKLVKIVGFGLSKQPFQFLVTYILSS